MIRQIVRAGAEVGVGEPPGDRLALTISGCLFVETRDGERVRATGGSIGAYFAEGRSGDRSARVTREQIEETIGMLVGRDLDLRPPHLAWEQIESALRQRGFSITEDELIALPLRSSSPTNCCLNSIVV
jgi:hypothetical protein